ncbi:tetratricopeptide repeat protein [Pendulispora rubella]|uniref:Tetratricopeptide repeat protein n=1 Tax=Pendulispora rubella TaxID=2741070 RepID=A0ABZ2KTW3_9BACT
MKALIHDLVGRLRGFVEQDDKGLLVVEANDASNGLLIKMLDTIDQEGADVHWAFADDFGNAITFVDAVAYRVYVRRELANKALAKEAKPPWPDLPREASDRSNPPVQRMRALMLYARDLIPDLETMHLVWVLFPASIADPAGYRAFVLELMTHEFPVWFHHMRVLVRDDVARPALRDVASVMHAADWCAPPLGPDDIRKALEDEAANKNLPLDERVQAVLTLAGIDYAHARLPAALEKYRLASRYYAKTHQHALHALAINGMGEVYARGGDAESARRHFESALTPALYRLGQESDPGRVDAAPVLLNVSLNLGNLYLSQRRWSEAGSYYERARDIAHSMRNVHVKIQCIENIGACHYELAQYPEAAMAWDEGTALARAVQAEEHLRALLERQRAAYDKVGATDRRDAIEAELRNLGPSGSRS